MGKSTSYCWKKIFLTLYKETYEQSKNNLARQLLFVKRLHYHPDDTRRRAAVLP